MKNKTPILKVRFDGEAVGSGRLPVAHLILFLENMNKAFLRTGMALTGEAKTLRRGGSNKQPVALDLVFLTHGSPAAILGFERSKSTGDDIFGDDFEDLVLETAIDCLHAVQEGDDAPSVGCDPGVLMAWRDAGRLFGRGISRIEFSLNHRSGEKVVTFNPEGFQNIVRRIRGPVKNIRTIEGRLLMADFKEHGTRCRIHPSTGDPVLCLFDLDRKDEVLENILQYVRILGEAEEDAATGKIGSIRIHDIEPLENKQNMGEELLPQGLPVVRNFWHSPSLDELANIQAVGPISDIGQLVGGWPGDADDGFEDEILQVRRAGMIGGKG